MKRNIFFYCFLLLVLLVTSTGCQAVIQISATPTSTPVPIQASETPLPTATATPIFQNPGGIPLGANLNCPDRAAFGYIFENTPARGINVNSPINFRWYYFSTIWRPLDWSADCVPTSFTLYLSPGPYYTEMTAYPVYSPNVIVDVDKLMFNYSFAEPLAEHTFYRWIIVGHAGDIDIDQEQLALFQDEMAWKVFNGNSIMKGGFLTGPLCTTQSIKPVNLLNPPDKAVLETDTPIFQWEMPDCAGRAYWLQYGLDLQLDHGWVLGQNNYLMSPNILQPCTQYYWQVQAGLYSIGYHLAQGDWATVSEIRSFSVRSLACPDGWVEPTLIPTRTFVPWTPTPTATQVPVRPTDIPATVPPPVNCSDYNTQEACEEHLDQCYWYNPGAVAAPSCKTK